MRRFIYCMVEEPGLTTRFVLMAVDLQDPDGEWFRWPPS